MIRRLSFQHSISGLSGPGRETQISSAGRSGTMHRKGKDGRNMLHGRTALGLLAALGLLMFLCAVIPARPAGAQAGEPSGDMDSLVITRAEITGRVGENIARFRMQLNVRSYSDEETQIVLLPADLAVTEWSVGKRFFGPDAYITRTPRGIVLVADKKGDFTVKLEFVLPVSDELRGHSVTVPLIRALVARTVIELPGEELEVTAHPATSMETVEKDGTTRVTVYGGEDRLTLSWRPETPVKVLDPVVFADQTLRADIGHGVMRLNSAIDYSILQEDVDRFRIGFPADCSLLDIRGRNIRSWNVERTDDGMQVLNVEMETGIRGRYSLELTLEKMLPEVEMEFGLPAIEPLDIDREKGRIAVSAARAIRVDAVVMEGISYMDVREIGTPPAAQDRELRMGFRYLRRPFSLVLRTGEVRAKTSAEVLTLVRTGMDSMRLNTRLNYTIRDAGVFEFRIGLDEGLRLIDISGENINNWQLDETGRELTVSLRSQAEGEYVLVVESELDFSRVSMEEVSVPAVQALNVERETGYVAVLPASGVTVETARLAGMSQIDVEELPAQLSGHDPALGFRYIRPGYTLAVNISEIQPEVRAEVRTIYTLGEHALDMHTEIHYTIRRAGVFRLRVAMPDELRRTGVEGTGIDDTSYDEEGGILTVNLRSRVIGDYVLTLETAMALTTPLEEVGLPVIETLDTARENGFLAVVTATSVRVKATEDSIAGLDSVGVSDLPPAMLRRAGEVALAFRYFSRPWALTLDVEPIEPRVTAEVFNLLSVGENLLSVSATASYSIANAGVDTFRVRLPAGATAVEFDGDAIRRSEKDADDDIWTIALQSRRIGNYTLFIHFQIELSEDQTLIPYPGVATPGVHRETGYLVVTSRPEVELLVADRDVENLTAIDAREVPETFTEGLETTPLLLAYRYISHPYMVRISALPHGAAEVTVAVVETARISTTITEEGNMITDLACIVRNTRQQYLDLRLPDDARTWHAFVDNRPVTPLRDGDVTKIPVARREGAGVETQEVRVRYSHARPGLGRTGSLRLDSPLAGIDVMRLGWTLSLPRGYEILRDSGPLRRVDGVHAMERRLQLLDPDSEVRVSVQQRRPAPSLTQMPTQRKINVRALEQAEAQGRAPDGLRTTLYTGVRPGEANVHAFQALIVSEGEPAWLQVQYLKGSVSMPLKGLAVLLILALCAGLWKACTCHAAAKIAALYACSLAALALRTLLEGAYRDYLSAAVYTLAAAATVMLVYTVAGWLRALWRRRPVRTRAREGLAGAEAGPEQEEENGTTG